MAKSAICLKKIVEYLESIAETSIFAPLFNRKHLKFGLWCNGSTTGFGSVCSGSNPGSPTTKGSDVPRECRSFCFSACHAFGRKQAQSDRKTRFELTPSFLHPSQREGKMVLLCRLSAGKRLFQRGNVYVFPRQRAGFSSTNRMFSLDKSNVFRGERHCFLRFRASEPPFSDVQSLKGRLFAPFFFQNFCKDFAIALRHSG